jgi:hypothetical protein
MSWSQLLKHNYLKYDYTKDLEPKGQAEEDDLLLSYNESSGIYSLMLHDNPR